MKGRVLFLLIAAILILRCFNAVFFPILHCEDGTEMLAFYANHPAPSGILHFYAGYRSVLPNLLGFLATSLLPLYIAPYVMVACSLAFATAALGLFSLDRYRFIMPDDTSRAWVCLILALVPLGNHALSTNLTYSIWNLFAISLLLVVAPAPRTSLGRVVQYGFLGLAIFSQPLSLILLPICLVLLVVRPSVPDRIANVGISVGCTLYALVGIRPAGNFVPSDLPAVLSATSRNLLHRVVFEPLLGESLRGLLYRTHHSWIVDVVAICVLVLIAVAILRSGLPGVNHELAVCGIAAFVMISATVISVVGRSMAQEIEISPPWAHRYFYVQQLAFVFLAALCVVGLARGRSPGRAAKAVLVALVSGYVCYLTVADGDHFATSRAQGLETLHFLRKADVALARSKGEEPGRRRLVMNRGGHWDIVIDVR
jgi:hypothetical protein